MYIPQNQNLRAENDENPPQTVGFRVTWCLGEHAHLGKKPGQRTISSCVAYQPPQLTGPRGRFWPGVVFLQNHALWHETSWLRRVTSWRRKACGVETATSWDDLCSRWILIGGWGISKIREIIPDADGKCVKPPATEVEFLPSNPPALDASNFCSALRVSPVWIKTGYGKTSTPSRPDVQITSPPGKVPQISYCASGESRPWRPQKITWRRRRGNSQKRSRCAAISRRLPHVSRMSAQRDAPCSPGLPRKSS